MLNEKQSLVANELKRNIHLLASAGTGKTNTLAHRIKNILEQGLANSNEILCLTFTNKACKEMKDRISSLAGPIADGVTVRTFHGLCFDIIKSESKRNTDIYTGFIIYDEEDSLSLLEDFKEENVSTKDIKIMIDFIRKEVIASNINLSDKMDTYNEAVETITSSQSKVNSFLYSFKHNGESMKRILDMYGAKYTFEYIERLRNNSALDFQDLMSLAFELFKDEEVVNRYASKYKFINVDEMQDTSVEEYSIIEKIFKDNNILLCGDNFQTIYEWRGSNPSEIFHMFKEKYNPVEVVFDCNYRATKVLTECSADFLRRAFSSEVASVFKDGIKTYSKEDGDLILFHEADIVKEEAEWIYSKILELPEEERKSVCLLTRNNDYNVELSDKLRNIAMEKENKDDKLDFALIDDSKFFKKPEIRNVLAFLKLISNHTDSVALKRILKTVSYKIGEATLLKVESPEYKENGILLADLIDFNALDNNDKFETLVSNLENNNIVVFDVESTGTDTTRDEIIQIAAIKINSKGEKIDEFVKFLKTDKSVGASESVHGFSDEFLRENGEDKTKTLLNFLDFIKGTVIVGHNVQYDINILTSELSRKDLPKPDFITFYDTLDLYRRFYPNLENHKLETISKFVNTKHAPNHNALYDILATGEILIHVIENNVIPTAEKRKELMAKVPDRFKVLASDMNALFELIDTKRPCNIIQEIVRKYNVINAYGTNSVQANNLRELFFVAQLHDDTSLSSRDALLDFVKLTALSDGEMERLLLGKGKIPIITIHQAKGLEFNNVFMAGLQDYIFPNYFAIKNNSFNEENRIFYVAMTRAKKKLYMSYSKLRKGKYQRKSCLLDNLSTDYLDFE